MAFVIINNQTRTCDGAFFSPAKRQQTYRDNLFTGRKTANVRQ
jgi:hypothetical protein